ncbi:hypothetical protein FHS78_001625 [Parvibaculum indicum]|uniref:divergent polysaccharide deacetylase family protein n=1 Tax=Parvibaculum indicum TaxID=562969 RepID=UPI00141E86CA|nr:divergent polysaccharide deacetylase family protein [Parvibaculum indicum]NIJ41338.1 hypothetical protein [Parvibaculum indicum]
MTAESPGPNQIEEAPSEAPKETAVEAGSAGDEAGARRRGPGLLSIVTILVALLYGGTLAWLVLGDHDLAGEPVATLSLPAPETENGPAKTEETPDMGVDGISTDPAQQAAPPKNTAHAPEDRLPADKTAPDAANDNLSPAERELMAAADRQSAAEIASQVKITGAASVDGISAPESAPVMHGRLSGPLPVVPDRALVESTAQGPLPQIGPQGRKPWRIYARPVPSGLPAKGRIAIVVSGMGISESATTHAIETLPPEVTLSFAPYGPGLQNWIDKARTAGHEVLLELPMEPYGYPQSDPGPYTLLTSLPEKENQARLNWLMSRFAGYAGVMNYQGARFSTSATALAPVLEALDKRGLMYIDNGASARSLAPSIAEEEGLPFARADRIVDPQQSAEVISNSLDALEVAAKQSGTALGVASGFPATVDEINEWAAGLGARGLTLVPATAAIRESR